MRLTKSPKITIGTGLLSVLLVCGARADKGDLPAPLGGVEDLENMGKMLFKLADTNNDNMISQKEAIDAGNLLAGGFFFRADANGDGTVTDAEATAAREALFNQKPLLRFIFQRGQSEVNQQAAQGGTNPQALNVKNIVDANHDGNISATELRQGIQSTVQTLFLAADKNGDGQLDPAEVNQAVLESGRMAIQTAFNAADSDKNGAVSQAEFDKAIINPAHVVFRILDANNDNQISADELRSGTQILVRELRGLQVPEPSNSLSNRISQGTTAAPRPATAVPGQPATTVTTPTAPPQR
jgi:Ca2+-binding EF-hand superfamily protein